MNTLQKRFHAAAGLSVFSLIFFGIPSFADDDHSGVAPVRADSHAPIGVMADHMHKKGEWMLSFRYMNMDMEDNLIGKDSVSNDYIVTTVRNRFFGAPGQPPTLRIVPTKMTMEMAMLGAMWAPADWVTLMLMGNYVSKEMDHVTYMGGAGTTVLGNFTTKASGLGDTYLGGMFKIFKTSSQSMHFNFGVTAPTGSTTKTDAVLTPMNMQPTVRLPYAMQLGSGTWDIKPGITYNGRVQNITFGAQYMGTFRTGNENGYNLGNVHEINAWAQYSPRPWFSFSGRLAWETRDRIDGIDPNIVGPVQTANPDFYGGDWFLGYLGMNFAGQTGWMRSQRLALEIGLPIEQDLNGPQMETDTRFVAGWQYAF